MRRNGPAGRRRERGIALVAVLLVMLLMLGIGAAFHTTVLTETVGRSRLPQPLTRAILY